MRTIEQMTRPDQTMLSRPFILCLMLSALLLLCRPSAAGPSESSQNRQTITVVSDDNYPPYIFRDVKGNLQGMLIDEWSLWEKRTGIKVDYRGMDWGKARKFMAGGNADVIDTIFFTDERAQQYDFSKPYATLEVPIFFHRNISGITDISSLHGFVIGVKDGDACIDVLRRSGISTLKTYHNYEHIVQAAANRDISVFCMDKPPALYYLYKFSIEKEYRHSRPLYSGQFHRAVKKGGTDLLGVIEGGFSKITGKEHEEIEKKWMGTTLRADPDFVRNIAYSLAGIGAIALLLVLWNLLLRKRVASRTAELRTTLVELRKKEEGLILSEKKFSTLFLSSPDGIVITDARDGAFTEVNDRFLEFLGYTRDEVIGRTVVGLGIWAVPDERKVFRRALAQKGLMNGLETTIRTKQGAIVPCLVSGRTIDIGGKPHVISVVTDISRRKSMEQGLRDSLDKFRSMAEQSLVGIYIVQDGVFKYVNRTFAELFGYTAGELINTRSPRDLTVPEDWALVEEHGRRRRAGTSLSGSYEIRGVRKDGGVVMIEVYESQALFEGRTANIGALLDISRRKKAEEAVRDSEGKLQAITRTAPDAIILLTDAGKISYWNPAAEMMFGYGAGEVMGKEPEFIIPERFREAHAFKRFAETGEGPKLGATVEMAGLRKDGTEFPLELSLTGFLLKKKRHASGIIRDITERKRLEGQLLHAQKMEAIGTLAGGIAHDFNNILNVIIGYGSLVLDGMGADNPSRDRMREVLSAADRAANLTKRLLMFSRKDVVDFKHIRVNDIVSGMEKMLYRIIGEDLELRIKVADKQAIIFADAGQLEQVLMNLVTNARDAMPKGGYLTISTGSAEIDDDYISAHGYGTAGKYASISVADTGVGMNAETQNKIFEPFYTTKGVGEGTGLGLSIAYGIIKQHKGFIQVTSEAGKGARFEILLPLSDKAASEHHVADSSVPQGGTETILIAEDEAPLRDLMRIILESFGYTVLAAEDGEEAVRMFLEHRDRVRLVILDMIMPKKNGKDAADEIKKAQPGIRTLFVSGYSEGMIKKQGGLGEGLVFIQKPFSAKVLLTKVRELLDA